MVAERAARAFWPLWSVLCLVTAATAFGLADALSPFALRTLAGLLLAALIVALVLGVRRFRWPSRDEALARLDASLPGRPIAALSDVQALGAADAGSAAVWRTHIARMADRAMAARAGAPDLRLSRRDPYALRYAALTALVAALIFGSLWRAADVVAAAAAGGGAGTQAGGPSWEGWAEPPAYTGRPSLYLNSIAAAELELPKGTALTLRLYGAADAISVTETVSGQAPTRLVTTRLVTTRPGTRRRPACRRGAHRRIRRRPLRRPADHRRRRARVGADGAARCGARLSSSPAR